MWLGSSLFCLFVPSEPLTWTCSARIKGVGVMGQGGLRDLKSGRGKALSASLAGPANTYHCPHCLQDATRTPLCHVQSLWRKAGSSQWAQTPMGTLSSPRAPKKRWEKSQGSYLVRSVGQRSRGDRGSGCPGRCPHADRAHGAGRGSPHARRGLL